MVDIVSVSAALPVLVKETKDVTDVPGSIVPQLIEVGLAVRLIVMICPVLVICCVTVKMLDAMANAKTNINMMAATITFLLNISIFRLLI